ncbi:hypothetical protein FRAAL3832 [Frankia alni ACN14a]|uniref:Uncharacterized protein n=1 Tax=Frankia alni (strain DSM 45986 / CECT 9034 / ACN14a) TaxID=326424 RepID=Q0RJ38_FRAAA|nr:hypothetical protein FRAAL3832 [Frankia alni ACN14a]
MPEVDVTPTPQTWLVVATLHAGARGRAGRRPRSELHASTLNPRQWQVNGPIGASEPRSGGSLLPPVGIRRGEAGSTMT